MERHFHPAILKLDARIGGCYRQPLRGAPADYAICAFTAVTIFRASNRTAHVYRAMTEAMVLHPIGTFLREGIRRSVQGGQLFIEQYLCLVVRETYCVC